MYHDSATCPSTFSSRGSVSTGEQSRQRVMAVHVEFLWNSRLVERRQSIEQKLQLNESVVQAVPVLVAP